MMQLMRYVRSIQKLNMQNQFKRNNKDQLIQDFTKQKIYKYHNRLTNQLFYIEQNKMYTSSPAFSIKGKYHNKKDEKKPSPFTYHVQDWNPNKTPSWKIGTDIKCPLYVSPNPGPGQYQSPYAQKSQKFGVIGKQNGRSKMHTEQIPSPNHYSPILTSKAPAITMAGKTQHIDKFVSPGPAAYQRNIQINTHYSIIGKEKRFSQEKEAAMKPGPGAYQYKRPSSAKVSIGREIRDCGKSNSISSPGPGQYQQKNLFLQSVKSSKGFSIAMKISNKDNEQRPGPANYETDFKKIYGGNPSFTIPRKYKPNKPAMNPGPCAYDAKLTSPKFYLTFQRAERHPISDCKNVPGPGNYQPQKIMKSSPKFSLGGSRQNQIKEDFPGPGAYQPDKNVVKSRPQSAKIGRQRRDQQMRQLSPGPCEYTSGVKKRPSTPSCAFGKDMRLKQKPQTTPGPGEYTIPSSVAYTASYALK